ncbi:MAG: ATP cone domain-containing protein [Candidatus Campbellbacteria bacterium]|nr:ATP cone domain-containing protein [Candidatus Campbellbacteria bacterium]
MGKKENEKEEVEIIKMDGSREIFDPNKLRHSLEKAGAGSETIEAVVSKIESEIEDGMTTGTIYKRAYEILERKESTAAARYSLRRALVDLGPTGFPFEEFVGEIFRAKGFDVKVGVMVEGECVEHEVDMLAENETSEISMEIKFHNSQKIRSDLKVALYVKSRFEDILSRQQKDGNGKKKEGWLLTNTKFTKNALDYAECVGLKIVSWSYPEKGNLQDLVEETGLHPLTCLTSLPDKEKTLLVEQGTVLCRDLKNNTKLLEELGFKEEKINKIKDEASKLCTPYSK